MKRFLKSLPKNKHSLSLCYLFAVLLVFFALLLGVMCGSTPLSLSKLLSALGDDTRTSPEARIFWYVRLPRTLASLFAGGALALSGAVLQGTLGNRLASPSVIGVNAGAGLAVTVASAMGVLGGFRLALFAFLGALLSVLLVALGAKKWGVGRGTVILMGVALNSLLGAASDAVSVFFPDAAVMTVAFRVGDFSGVSYVKLTPAVLLILIASSLLFTLSHEHDVLTLGDENAYGLGLRVGNARSLFLMLAAMLSGAAVCLAGLLSFVGLLVPHAVRPFSGASSKHLFPLSLLFGGGFVCLCDTLSRVVLAPYEFPVGIPIALIGAPFFLFVLINGREGKHCA
ncbi:MAG: iron ABC transporter permease [Ruminococcaceae bacterium]|nr:iron ABC transporter permease [Oscillospiraceae bacterium]